MNRSLGLLVLLALVSISRSGDAQRASVQRSASDSIQDRLLRHALDVPGATLEYRWATDAGQKHDSSASVVYDSSSRTLFVLDRDVLFTLKDVRAVDPVYSSGQGTVVLSLKPDVARRLDPSFAAHMRHFLAVFINGRFVTAPFVTSPVARAAPVVINADSTLAAALVARLRARINGHTEKQSN